MVVSSSLVVEMLVMEAVLMMLLQTFGLIQSSTLVVSIQHALKMISIITAVQHAAMMFPMNAITWVTIQSNLQPLHRITAPQLELRLIVN